MNGATLDNMKMESDQEWEETGMGSTLRIKDHHWVSFQLFLTFYLRKGHPQHHMSRLKLDKTYSLTGLRNW